MYDGLNILWTITKEQALSREFFQPAAAVFGSDNNLEFNIKDKTDFMPTAVTMIGKSFKE